jgi:hypothetical protein
MDDVGNVLGRIFGRFIGPTDEPDTALTETAAGKDDKKETGPAQPPRSIPPAIAAE